MSGKFPLALEKENIFLSSHLCPTSMLVSQVEVLGKEQGLCYREKPIAIRTESDSADFSSCVSSIDWLEFDGELDIVEYPWDLIEMNGRQIKLDFELLTQGRKSAEISSTNNLISAENIFVEEGAKLEYATINASGGSVYIGKDAEVMEGSFIRGPFALCEHATVNMGSKIYGGTTIGPWSKVGGEVTQSILTSYSNKGHDGFLGHSILGEWCNLGAGTNVSNLKNTYDKVRVWSYADNRFAKTGLQFCGLIMGDHSKVGINTMFNTGTVVGICSNVYGAGFPRNFVPSFSMGGAQGFTLNNMKSVFKTASQAMARRKIELSLTDQQILTSVFEQTARYRKF